MLQNQSGCVVRPVDTVSLSVEGVPGQGRNDGVVGGDVGVETSQDVLFSMREGPGEVDLGYEDLSLGESELSHSDSTLQLSGDG